MFLMLYIFLCIYITYQELGGERANVKTVVLGNRI